MGGVIREFGMPKWWYNRTKWKNAAYKAYERDEGKCRHCGKLLIFGHNVDHITPINPDSPQHLKYGLDNLQTLCIPCHNKKSTEDHINFKRYQNDNINAIIDLAVLKINKEENESK